MKASIVIPTYNKLPRLKLAMASLKNQNYPFEKFEVIIVDNGSTDGTADFLESYRPSFDLKYLHMENKGRAAARNKGLEYARNELVIFTDDDLILSPDFISEHVRLQKENNGVVHGKIINLSYLKFFEDPSNGILYSYLNNGRPINEAMKSKCISETDILNRFEEVIAPNDRVSAIEMVIWRILEEEIQDISWIGFTGGNVSVTKEILNHTGVFNENFGLNWGCEDLELGYRICRKGYKFTYGDKAMNYHISHYRPNFDIEHSKTAQLFYEKYKDPNILYFQDFVAGKISGSHFEGLIKNVHTEPIGEIV